MQKNGNFTFCSRTLNSVKYMYKIDGMKFALMDCAKILTENERSDRAYICRKYEYLGTRLTSE